MAPSAKNKLKRKAWISPMTHGKWRNWAMPNNFGKMASKPKEWLDKLGKKIRKPPDVGGKIARAKLVKLTPQTIFKDARTKAITWLATKTPKNQGFEEFFKKFSILVRMNPHIANKFRRVLAKSRAGIKVENNEFPNFNLDFQDLTLEDNGILEELQNLTLDGILSKPFFGTPTEDASMIQGENWLFDPLSLDLTERLYDIVKSEEADSGGNDQKNDQETDQENDQDNTEEGLFDNLDDEPMLPVGENSLLQAQLTENCAGDENPELCKFKMEFVKKQFKYPPLEKYDPSAGPENF